MTLFFAAAGWESIVTLLVFLGIGVISNWLKNRQQPDETGADPAPPLDQKPRPTKAAKWEEELRRILEGGETESAPRPPPVIVQEKPRPAPSPRAVAPPPPVPRPSRVTVPEVNEEDEGLPVHMPTLTESAQAYLRGSTIDDRVAERMRARGAMAEAAAAHHRASQIDEQAAEHLGHRTGMVTHCSPQSRAIANRPQIAQARALVRQRQSLQSAIIASVILGPPKALEN